MSNTSARILAIDDDDAILSLLADALSPPHQVATAQEWLEGVDLLMNQQFDLLIIDLACRYSTAWSSSTKSARILRMIASPSS